MKLEELESVMGHPRIKLLPISEEGGKLCRDRSFIIGDELYSIEWWINVSYLRKGGLLVVFDNVKRSHTWPNRAKLNLQFYYNDKVVAVIELEPY